jgi:hypothetical protein
MTPPAPDGLRTARLASRAELTSVPERMKRPQFNPLTAGLSSRQPTTRCFTSGSREGAGAGLSISMRVCPQALALPPVNFKFTIRAEHPVHFLPVIARQLPYA